MRKLIALTTAAALALAATLTTASPTAAATATHVGVTLKEMSVTLSAATVPSGSVTFDVTNAGAVEHEIVILKTDIDAGSLPPNVDEAGKVAEFGHVDEIDPVTGTMALTVDLRPGNYIVLCNKPGHYAAGMFAALTVSAPAGINVKKLPRSVSAAIDMALALRGIEDLEDVDALVDVKALLTAPGVVITDADRAAIAAGIFPRAIAADGTLLY